MNRDLKLLLPNSNFKTLNFLSMLRLKDRKFIKKTILKYFHIDVKLTQPSQAIHIVTFITINRILKKIKNTLYWHILRMY